MGECFLQNFCCIFVLLIQLEIHFFGPKTQHLKLQPNAKNAIWNWQSCMFRKPSKYKASQEVEVYLTAKLMRASLCMWMFHVTIKASNLHQIPHEYAITNLGYKSKEHNFQCLEIIKEQQPTEMRVFKVAKRDLEPFLNCYYYFDSSALRSQLPVNGLLVTWCVCITSLSVIGSEFFSCEIVRN